MKYEFQLSGTRYTIQIDIEKDLYRADLGSGPLEIDARPISDHCLSLIIGNSSYKVFIASNDRKTYLHIDGHQFCLEETEHAAQTDHGRSGIGGSGEQSVCAPMPGTVVTVLVKEGDLVEKNQSLVIVESMKMENVLRSPLEGRVEKINFRDGDLVDAGVPIIELVPKKESG
jgi:biotin carboxyl carrier protein